MRRRVGSFGRSLSFSRRRRGSAAADVAVTEDDGKVLLEGKLWLGTPGGRVPGTVTLVGGRLTHRPDEAGCDTVVRVSEMSVVELVSHEDFTFCVATSTASVSEFGADGFTNLMYWLEGLRAFIGGVDGGSADEPAAAAPPEEPAVATAASPDCMGSSSAAAPLEAEAAAAAAVSEAASEAASIYLHGPLWMLTEGSWVPGLGTFVGGILAHQPEDGSESACVRLSELSLIEAPNLPLPTLPLPTYPSQP